MRTTLFTRPKKVLTCVESYRKVVKEGGILGLYKGFWGTVYFRTFCGVYFGTYEFTKVPPDHRNLGAFHVSNNLGTYSESSKRGPTG